MFILAKKEISIKYYQQGAISLILKSLKIF